MDRVLWNDDYSVGNKELDDQHLKIFSLINDLVDKSGQVSCKDLNTSAIREMIRYAKEHLLFEERLLKEVKYPDYDSHVELHKEYLITVAELSMKLMKECDENTKNEFLTFLAHWWKNHILNEDMKYKSYIQNNV